MFAYNFLDKKVPGKSDHSTLIIKQNDNNSGIIVNVIKHYD